MQQCVVRAIGSEELDPFSDYSVHSLPNPSTTIEPLKVPKGSTQNGSENDQKSTKNLIERDKTVRNNSVENQSTKITQERMTWQTNEDTSLDALTENEVPDFSNEFQESSTDGCDGVHNSAKNYSKSSAAQLLIGMLKIGPNHLYSQFQCDDPRDSYIPTKAQIIYQKSVTWMPHSDFFQHRIINDYLQCVTFVFMSYELAGKPIIKQGRTNAADLLAAKYTGPTGQFKKFQSGQATQLPVEGDLLVWSTTAAKNQYGHVGIVLETRIDSLATDAKKNLGVDGKPKKKFGTILVANSNASQLVYEYQYRIDIKTGVVTLDKLSDSWSKVPDYWLQMKE